ncbi:hypothetical protein [Fimbriiglobus ruber]|uniref:hypothetical protein n=1 Tax=Fimbriiglobus ruber TaxID=1908690 RepID=UPI00117B52E7|nr:hypothetical protein [Fimbriiglobus ruber]
MDQLIYSVALYCEREREGSVSEAWLDGVLELLASHGLYVREYSVTETPVCEEGDYAFQPNDPRLLAAVRSGVLRDLFLYCHPQERRGLVFDWNGCAAITLSSGEVFMGLPATSGVRLDELLRQTYALARPFGSWPYGIAYSRSSSMAPSMYAYGFIGGAAYMNVTRGERDRISCWRNELMERRSHLEGRLRDVYPANLLSAIHTNARVGEDRTLLNAGWGEFTEIDDKVWLWTVPEEDISEVRAVLIQANLLICP